MLMLMTLALFLANGAAVLFRSLLKRSVRIVIALSRRRARLASEESLVAAARRPVLRELQVRRLRLLAKTQEIRATSARRIARSFLRFGNQLEARKWSEEARLHDVAALGFRLVKDTTETAA